MSNTEQRLETAILSMIRIAVRLAEEGKLVILRKGKIADPHDFRGVYRLSQPRFE
jgi:hypothetical protein